MDFHCFIWNKFLAVVIELEPHLKLGGSCLTLNLHVMGEVPDLQFTLNLFLPWKREVHVQLGAFVVCKGSWPTYDIELEPPIEWGGSVPSSNFHRIEKVPDARLTSILDILWNRRIHIRLWTFMNWRGSGTTFDVYTRPPVTSKTSYPTLDLPKNWEVPDARLTSILDLLWYRRIHI